ncbi:hypothetical protein CI105_01370 [Candidatus Izimaplasma bacterium ZiA1]|uniref:M17 family metallopeptidase n=1 Tax=Candidatus Izimoplasma sp. ZiA1 TaxID=2024899 RepID=UPI000BAA85FF|nr:hypothetical protein CI105_01370 [Candidatus Izimaplasma bacterium ZiA1]
MITEQKDFNFSTETKNIILTNNTNNQLVKDLNKIMGIDLSNSVDEPFTTIYTLGKISAKKVYIVNFEDLKNEKSKEIIIKGITSIKENTVMLIDTFEHDNYLQFVELLSERIISDNYVLNTFKSKYEDQIKEYFVYGETNVYSNIKKGYIIGECVNKAKTLVNTPYNYMNATDLANYAKNLEKIENVEVTIYDKKAIEKMNMGAFLGVNKGSYDEPKLIQIKYKGKKEFKDPVALVGKGVMYDTGGYSLKTPQSMPGMKVDMAGAAAVVSAIEAIARLQLEENVMSIVAATDNRIGDNAIVPDDIITSALGKTIEIVSTDAEGRLTLADAVWFAQKEGSKKIIDIATLTGAMVAALGGEFTGAFTNNYEFYNEFKEVTEKTNEKIWEMPVTKAYHDKLKSKTADISNKGGKYAGASIAAAFIEEFIEDDTAWIHLDVAGTASDEKNIATGVMVKTFTEFFCK